jgi:hypothetical protein
VVEVGLGKGFCLVIWTVIDGLLCVSRLRGAGVMSIVAIEEGYCLDGCFGFFEKLADI